MGRKQKPKTIHQRIREEDKKVIQQLAKQSKMSFPDYVNKMVRRHKRWIRKGG